MPLTPKPQQVAITEDTLEELAALIAGMNDYLDVTAGTVAASKAVVADANGAVNFPKGTALSVGAFSSTSAGSGVPLSASLTKALYLLADDGNAAIASGSSVRTVEGRVLLGHAQTGNVSVHGAVGHVKVEGALTHTGHVGGAWGYAELDTTGSTTGPVAGVYAMCDLPTGAVVGTGGVLSGLLVGSNTLEGTHTGRAVAVHVQNPVAGTFDAFAEIGSATGATAAAAAGATNDKHLVVYVGGVKYTAPLYRA